MSEFHHEPVRGLPAELPAGERILWQGSPEWTDLAISAFHVRKVIVYFGVLAVGAALLRLSSGEGIAAAAVPFLWLVPMGAAAAGLLALLAWASARTTIYTVTDRRLVMRIGVALDMTINIPFKLIDSAAVRLRANGQGDIPFTLHPGNHLAYLMLWPHARPGRYARPEPMLRSLQGADRIASLISAALAGRPLHLPALRDAQSADPSGAIRPALA